MASSSTCATGSACSRSGLNEVVPRVHGSGRGLKPNLAAVYSARQQRSTNHSRASSPGIGGGRFVLDPGLFGVGELVGDSPYSPQPPSMGVSVASSSGATMIRQVSPTSPTGVVFRTAGLESIEQRPAKPPRQCSPDSCASVDSSDSDHVGASRLIPAPPPSLPPNRSGGSLHGQRRKFWSLEGVRETEPRKQLSPTVTCHPPGGQVQGSAVPPIRRLEPQADNLYRQVSPPAFGAHLRGLEPPRAEGNSPRQAWEFSPRTRSESSHSDVPLRPLSKPEVASRDGSVTPTLTMMPPSPGGRASFRSRALPMSSHSLGTLKPPTGIPDPFGRGGGGYHSPRCVKTPSELDDDYPVKHQLEEDGSFHAQLRAAAAAACNLPFAPRDKSHVCEPMGEEHIEEHGIDSVGELDEEIDMTNGSKFSMTPLREGWQMSLCHNVVLHCPAKLPTKDVFAPKKVPRPVSLEGSPDMRSSRGSSECSLASSIGCPFTPPCTNSLPVSPRKEGRRYGKDGSEQAESPKMDSELMETRISLLLQEDSLRAAGLIGASDDERSNADSAHTPVLDDPVFDDDEGDDDERDAARLRSVKLEIVRGLTVAAQRRSSAEDVFSSGTRRSQRLPSRVFGC